MTTLIDVIRRAIAGHVGLAFDDAPPHRRSYIDQRIERPEWTCNTATQEDLTDAAQAALTALQESAYVIVPVEPTTEMLNCVAGTDALRLTEGKQRAERNAYRAMLKAAQGEG